MLVVHFDLWRWGRPPEGREDNLATVVLVNDGTGTPSEGNYDIYVLREEETVVSRAWADRTPDLHIHGVARRQDQKHLFRLVARALVELSEAGMEPAL
jgi:hypothetical protein